ncbi:MAG: hypothetical protein IK083_03720 [Abditibacteriota bacterium]|nr:hypothetical protein [Abditibacteriota bacterium]
MALIGLVKREVTGEQEQTTCTETLTALYSDVYPYVLTYPAIGAAHRVNPFVSGNTDDLICTRIKVNPEPQWIGGNQIATLEATFAADYSEPEGGGSAYSVKISSGGTRSYKMQAGGVWAGLNLSDNNEQSALEYQAPITDVSLTTKYIGSAPPYAIYEAYVGKLNQYVFPNASGYSSFLNGYFARNPGCVLFESYSTNQEVFSSGVAETEVTLNLKLLPIDWNYEYRNPLQFVNPIDGKPAFWQNSYPGRFDYTQDGTKVGTPVWSGAVQGYGDSRRRCQCLFRA